MTQFNYLRSILVIFTIILSSFNCQLVHAQQISGAAVAASDETSWWDQGKVKVRSMIDDGSLSIALSGYAHHGRGTYTPERIKELNEKAWGLGFSKQIRTIKGNEESLYAFAISDSHFKPQMMAGYMYQWMLPLGHHYEAGVGVTGILISRADYFSGIPFPVALPVASIGSRNTKLMAAYIPRLSGNKGNGDVLLLFARIELN